MKFPLACRTGLWLEGNNASAWKRSLFSHSHTKCTRHFKANLDEPAKVEDWADGRVREHCRHQRGLWHVCLPLRWKSLQQLKLNSSAWVSWIHPLTFFFRSIHFSALLSLVVLEDTTFPRLSCFQLLDGFS